jgi:hypothetical protein
MCHHSVLEEKIGPLFPYTFDVVQIKMSRFLFIVLLAWLVKVDNT